MSRAGLGHEHKPIGCLVRQANWRETEVTVQLFKALGIELRFDMSEYMERRHTVSR